MKYLVIKHAIEETIVDAANEAEALAKLGPETQWEPNGWTEIKELRHDPDVTATWTNKTAKVTIGPEQEYGT